MAVEPSAEHARVDVEKIGDVRASEPATSHLITELLRGDRENRSLDVVRHVAQRLGGAAHGSRHPCNKDEKARGHAWFQRAMLAGR